MRDRLLRGISELCLLFPPLKPSISYSDVLSQEEIGSFAAVVNGHVDRILNYSGDEKEQERQLSFLLKSSFGLSKIRSSDVLYVESLLSSASGSDELASSKFRNIVFFLRSHKDFWWRLHNAYETIVKNNLVGTCPLAVSNPPFIVRVFGLHRFEEFHKLFHESIHFVLEDNGICFHDKALDEGLVVYMHQQVMGKKVCSLHYVGNEGSSYLRCAERFERIGQKNSDSDLLSVLKIMSVEEIKAQ